MALQIVHVRVLPDSYMLELALSDGSVVYRDVSLVRGPVFDPIWRDRAKFRRVRVVDGVLTWPGDVDLCSDAVLRGGLHSGRPPAVAMLGARGTLLDMSPRRRL